MRIETTDNMAKDAPDSQKPYIIVYGDGDSQALTKAIWSLLSSRELQLANVSTAEELARLAPGAVLIVMAIEDAHDEKIKLATSLLQNDRVIADIIAITEQASVESRTRILASGFDGAFNNELLDTPDFKKVMMNRVEKGFTLLENRLQQEEYRRFRAALAASSEAFIIFDENHKLFFVSEHYKHAYPVSASRLVRGLDVMKAFELCSTEQGVTKEDPRYQALHDFWKRMEGDIEFENKGRIWFVKARKLPEGQGTIVTTSDITRYIQQQHDLEEQSRTLAEALTKEQEASALQKQFINMISHEFKTPLSIIDGNAQILQRRGKTLDEETIAQRTRTIRSAVSRLVNLMEGILSSNMLKTGRLEIAKEPLNLKQLIKELCHEQKNLTADYRIETDIDRLPGELLLDRKVMTLVISNLLSNAVKFTRGNPCITIAAYQENQTLFLEFEDNGIGIPADEIGRIFDRYYRTTTATHIPGSGIGLSLVKDLVNLCGGDIFVDSEVGKGSKFVISLPLTS